MGKMHDDDLSSSDTCDTDTSDLTDGDSDDGRPRVKKEKKKRSESKAVDAAALVAECKEKLHELAGLQQGYTGGSAYRKKGKQAQAENRRQEKRARQKIKGEVRRIKKKLRMKKLFSALKEIEEEEKRMGKPTQRTLDNMREEDVTTLKEEEDDELEQEENVDAFSHYYAKSYEPKILVTSSNNRHRHTHKFVKELCTMIPNSQHILRRGTSVKAVVDKANEEGFTDVLIVNEDKSHPNALLVIHLPEGPTALFRVSNFFDITKISRKTKEKDLLHRPEVILNNFTTRLGRVVARMLGALFHYDPEFKGRRVCTFHNQRDFIFFRHHRYEFKSAKKVALKELGPRFTLRLQWLQQGAFQGDYEWVFKKDMETSRRRFFL